MSPQNEEVMSLEKLDLKIAHYLGLGIVTQIPEKSEKNSKIQKS